MALARELRNSGSDIVVEEDLAQLFGRSRISPEIASSFKTIVSKSSSNRSLWEGITLQGGPGPTVLRALREAPYFAMVVQLSLLVWVCDKVNLAASLAKLLEERADHAAQESSKLQPAPDVAGLLGVLSACEEQTAAFDWNLLLHAVAAALGISLEGYDRGRFPGNVLCEAAEMFHILQHFPLERIVTINFGPNRLYKHGLAMSALLVWAHHILGLNVLVKRSWYENGILNERDISFDSPESGQVIIEETEYKSVCSIALLEPLGESLVTIQPRAEEIDLVGTILRTPARGWGTRFLIWYLRSRKWSEVSSTVEAVMVKEMQITATALAQLIAGHLRRTSSYDSPDPDRGQSGDFKQIPCVMNRQDLLETAGFLFDIARIDEAEVELYIRGIMIRNPSIRPWLSHLL